MDNQSSTVRTACRTNFACPSEVRRLNELTFHGPRYSTGSATVDLQTTADAAVEERPTAL